MKNNSVIEIVNVMLKSQHIYISGHTGPDGDAIGSMTALCIALENVGKKPKLVLEKASSRYDVIPYNKYVTKKVDKSNVDLFIVVDCGSTKIFNNGIKEYFDNAKKTINIDHHLGNDYYGDYNYVLENASSTSEIIYDFVKEICEINKDIATSLYSGIVYDTGGFRHNTTTKNTHKIAGEFLELGIDFTNIYFNILRRKTLKEMQILQLVTSRIKVVNKNINYSYITIKDLEDIDATIRDLSGMIDFVASLEGMEVSIFIYEKKQNHFKYSLRSRSTNINEVASYFGGGGHRLASGCTIEGKLEDTITKVMEKTVVAINDKNN